MFDARGNQSFMRVRDNRGNVYDKVPTADFIEDLIGRAVPPAGLSSWVTGRIWSQAQAQVLAIDDQGRIVRMQQSGWTISTAITRSSSGAW